MSTRWLLTVEAQDQPGIVAGVTRALADSGCNLADVAMTRLSGMFVMLAVVEVPAGLAVDHVWHADEAVTTWREISNVQTSPLLVAGARWNVTVYGSDKPGIVAAVAMELANLGVNIDDMSTRLVDETYMIMIEATVPESVDDAHLQSELTSIGHTLGVTCRAAAVDVDTF